MTNPKNTIIFGASGAVGLATALAAQSHGANVSLAMRDPKRAIKNLSPSQEASSGFSRVQTDLTQPESISAAVTKTGAKRAFIYMIFQSSDHMRGSIEALKAAGIEWVVMLSSYSIYEDLPSITAAKHGIIAYLHAQVELNLQAVFGSSGYVAVRPAFFASNLMMWKTEGVDKVKLVYPDASFDFIVPADIGRVCGALTAGGAEAAGGKSFIQLCGPQLISLKDAISVVGKAQGKHIAVEEIDEKAAVELLVADGALAEPVAEEVVASITARRPGHEEHWMYVGEEFKEAQGNILKYSGHSATTFEKWAASAK